MEGVGNIVDELHFLGNFTSTGNFTVVSADMGNGGELTIGGGNTPCYCRGTLILTELGERAVEELAIDDRVATRAGLRPIKWVGRRSYDPRFIRGQKSVLPVVISAGARAHGVPAGTFRKIQRRSSFEYCTVLSLISDIALVSAAPSDASSLGSFST